MTRPVTVVGGGIGGLVAAVELAEAGVPATVLEARAVPGGRARSVPGPWVANLGPHAVYRGGSLWRWLDRRGLTWRLRRVPVLPVRLRVSGVRRVRPPLPVLAALRGLRRPAPVDRSFTDWVSTGHGPDVAAALASVAGVFTFDHDPGRLSAAFVAERLRRFVLARPVAHYAEGGWSALVDDLVAHARSVGVELETDARVDRVPDGPVVLAVGPTAAARLLPGIEGVTTARTALLDVGLAPARRRGPSALGDLDGAGFATRVTATVPALAPRGHDLVQTCVGVAGGTGLDDGVAALEDLLDVGWPGWRAREVWRRRALVTASSGAVDLPGSTWRDRPAVDRGGGVWLVGDWVAAPGHLAEVSCASAVAAAAGIVARWPRSGERPLPAPAAPAGRV
jgi:hypothetical protein